MKNFSILKEVAQKAVTSNPWTHTQLNEIAASNEVLRHWAWHACHAVQSLTESEKIANDEGDLRMANWCYHIRLAVMRAIEGERKEALKEVNSAVKHFIF